MTEFVTTSNYILMLVNERIYRPFEPEYRIEIPDEDMRLVFSYLSANEWGSIALSFFRTLGRRKDRSD